MPALYIAKSADVPRLLFAPGEKRAGFYFVTRRVYPMSAFLSSLFRFIFPRSSAFFAAAAAQSAFQSHRVSAAAAASDMAKHANVYCFCQIRSPS